MDPRDDVMGATWLASRYQVAGLRAQGALCFVYQGQDAVLQRPVAIKAPLRPHVDDYRATLQISSTLAHPAFLALYDLVEQGDGMFLAYEFVEGRPLAQYLSTGLPPRRAVRLMLQVARAIAYAHAHGVGHGDLTPAAILIDRSATARVANVGLPPDEAYFDDVATSAFASSVADDPDTTATMLTERIERMDTWAIAAMLWQLITDVSVIQDGRPRIRAYRADTPKRLREILDRSLRVGHSDPLTSSESLAQELAALDEELAAGAVDAEEPIPDVILALRARAAQIQRSTARESSGSSGLRWRDSRDAASPTATTAYGEHEPLSAVHDANITQPSRDRAREREEAYAIVAPRISLPSRPLDAPNAPLSDAARAAFMRPTTSQTAPRSLSGWMWTLISVAVFALCFLIGFLLAGIFPLAPLP